MPNGNSIAVAKLGPWDNVAPAEVNANTFTTAVYFSGTQGQPGSVMAQWQGAVDNPAGGSNAGDGVGVAYYSITRATISGTDPNTPTFQSFDASVYDGTVLQSNTGNRSVVRDFAAHTRISRSSLAGRSHGRKKCSVAITLAGSLTASGSGGFRLRTRSR
jgi:hypothetical protein